MKHLKNYISLALIACMILTFASCGVPENTVFSADDIKGKTIGVQEGTTGDIYASDKQYKATVERYKKGTDAVLALKQGKVDCVIIDEQPAKEFVKNNSDLKILKDEFVTEDYAICMAKGNTELKAKINTALAQLKEDGTLDKIIKNYIGDSTKGKYPYKSPANVSRSNGTLKMATNAQFPPYEFYNGKKVVGIDADMAKAIADKLGMELKIEDMNFDSIIAAVETGKVDVGIAGMTVTKDRLKSVDFSDSYTTSKQVIIVRVK